MKYYYEAWYMVGADNHFIGIFNADCEDDVYDWCENWLMENHPGVDTVSVMEIYEWDAKDKEVIEL